MGDRRAQQRIILTFIIALVALAAAFQLFKRPVYGFFADFFSPVLSVPSAASEWMDATRENFKSREHLLNENRRLAFENEQLWAVRNELETLRQQHAALRKLLDLTPLQGYVYKRAEVILRDPTAWNTVFTVGMGSRDGVSPGYPVLALSQTDRSGRTEVKLVVVGRVEAVSDKTAQVRTLLHPDAKLSVVAPVSAAAGILCGGSMDADGNAILEMRYLSRQQKLAAGEQVCTSGLTPFTPEGFSAGTVVADEKGETVQSVNNLDATARVRLSADISSLRFVVIPVPSRRAELRL